jgi:hypothetical protein
MEQFKFLVFCAFKFCRKVLEIAADFVFSRASTASSSLSRVLKIPICSSCFSTQLDLGTSGAFASSTESSGGITSSAIISKLASHLEEKIHNNLKQPHNTHKICTYKN